MDTKHGTNFGFQQLLSDAESFETMTEEFPRRKRRYTRNLKAFYEANEIGKRRSHQQEEPTVGV
jgi:hypothetical protein